MGARDSGESCGEYCRRHCASSNADPRECVVNTDVHILPGFVVPERRDTERNAVHQLNSSEFIRRDIGDDNNPRM
jgi:hypothetical protein